MSTEFIHITTPARAGILGNPSDGFYGKTLSIPVRNFNAEIFFLEWDYLEILPGQSDKVEFTSLNNLIKDIKLHGYYGGIRLIKAAIMQFSKYIEKERIELPEKLFSIRYRTQIPRQVGLAGSSAIITSTFKALLKFYNLTMDPALLANYVLWSETKELGISAGLQDRVVQVFNCPVYMDFDKEHMEKYGIGKYRKIEESLFPPFYIAYLRTLTHKIKVHNDVRKKWEEGDPKIRETMRKLAYNVDEGMEALRKKDWTRFDECINRNFDLREQIYPISRTNKKMIEIARSIGLSAKFTGSGGAIIGTCYSERKFNKLKEKLAPLGCNVIRVKIGEDTP